MPSLDNIYDLVEKLDKEKFDYLIIALKKNKKGEEASGTMIFNLEDDDSKSFMLKALTKFKKSIK